MSAVDLRNASLIELDFPQVLSAICRYCISENGKERITELSPLSDVTELRNELMRVQECADFYTSNAEPPLQSLPDVRSLLKKARIEGNFLSAPELLTVLEVMQASRVMRRFLTDRGEHAPYLNELCEVLIDDRVLEKHVMESIDDTGAVRDSASRELLTIRRDIHELESRLRRRLHQILKKFGEEELLQEDFITQRDGRFVLPLRVENKRAVDGIIHGVSQTGSTVFFEPAETYEMNNEMSLLKGREQREIIRILTTLTSEINAVGYSLEAAYEVMVTVDTLLARARYALDNGGIRPVIVDEDYVELNNVRHPVLVQHARSTSAVVVPLSVLIDKNARGILISGPNAGGKTVAMKAIGLSLVMAMSGIFPLGACTTNVRRIFTAIGDHQSIESNLSTFSSQIIRIRDILSECSQDALVLIDEICAGTDPAEGGALAAGVLDSIIERGACFVVTTHQSSLKQYALAHDKITNASLAFDDEKVQPTFKFQYGVPGNSYAFDLARNVGLPDVVIKRSKDYLGGRHDELEESISAMQKFRREAELALIKANENNAQAERIKKELEEKLVQIRAKRGTIVEEAREEARVLLQKANALIENTIKEIREGEKSAAEAKKSFESARKDIISRLDTVMGNVEEPVQAVALTPGTAVRVTGTGGIGEVIAIEGDNVVVDVNGKKFRISANQLEIMQATGKTKHRASASPAQPLNFDATTSLDMRGMRADEGLKELEHFLDDAIMKNVPFVEIIHGKGTGTLRNVVHNYLKDRSGIKSFRIGSIHEGGDGITIVEVGANP